MRFYHNLCSIGNQNKQLALAIGNFDGFHRGHQAVIRRLLEISCANNLCPAVMIFEPQPREVFSADAPARIYSLRDKLRAFEGSGVEIVFCMRFNEEFSSLTPEQYVCDLLKHKLHVKYVTVGSQFYFGCGGKADITVLQDLGVKSGISAEAIDGIGHEGERISSTLIRKYLEQGKLDSACRLLGHPYAILGKVVHGNAIGRTMGFPTANVNLRRRKFPLKGVFAVRVRIKDTEYAGVANVGSRPTVMEHQKQSLLEVHLFDFAGDLYGKSLEVSFVRKLRDEKKFSGLEELKGQIQSDLLTARQVLNGL
ncbi:MAG: bifunctional riboflavin kinase/FAD synthetase [Succinivibrio sp.]|nr:bifunctional riboflavin kinase/FAD synthetase [Succinivibrio sp.]